MSCDLEVSFAGHLSLLWFERGNKKLKKPSQKGNVIKGYLIRKSWDEI